VFLPPSTCSLITSVPACLPACLPACTAYTIPDTGMAYRHSNSQRGSLAFVSSSERCASSAGASATACFKVWTSACRPSRRSFSACSTCLRRCRAGPCSTCSADANAPCGHDAPSVDLHAHAQRAEHWVLVKVDGWRDGHGCGLSSGCCEDTVAPPRYDQPAGQLDAAT
jgi:hypothetical protein